MMRTQFRVLYRDFLFRIVDREVLSTYAKGDASQLLLQIVALLVCLSVLFCIPALTINAADPAQARLIFGWSMEHFLIATTMLVVGIFSVLSWDSMFPSHRDVLVLGPLPVRAHTILLAKLAAVATALTLAVTLLHAATGLVWPLALNAIARPHPEQTWGMTMAPAVPAVGAADLKSVLDRDLAEAVKNGPLTPGAGGGIAIGIYQRGIRNVFTYGAATPDSVFGIGSITKPFTGLLLARMAQEGKVTLDEPVRALIPAAGLPPPSGREITLIDLATHRSGLPNMPPAFRPANSANPHADFDVSKLYNYLASHGVGRPSGPRFVYSNLGFGLLAHALSQRAGLDYGTLVREAITEPLGMRDTAVTLSPAQRRRFLQGYDDEGRPAVEWEFDVTAGAGALKSTAPDMLTWLQAHLDPARVPSGPLSAAFAAARRIRSTSAPDSGAAPDWFFNAVSGDYQHGGAIGGFTADAFFNPGRDVAVVVLSNVGPGTWLSGEVLGEHIRARISGQPAMSITRVAVPTGGSIRSGLRTLAAYWTTMFLAGAFVFGMAMTAQGLAAALLPRRLFLRVSPLLQLAAFGLIVGGYLLQPLVVMPLRILAAHQEQMFASSPSYWFLGLFQALNGSAALAPLAGRAWIGLALALGGIVITYGLSYVSTLRRIAEQPDVAPSAAGMRWLPPFGDAPQTALVQFSVRTQLRSAPHRVILAFYWGLGFALAMLLLKTPRGQQLAEGAVAQPWQETSVPLILSSVMMTGFAVMAARLAFAMPRDLPANWIFRVVPSVRGSRHLAARRRALLAVSAAPVWAASAGAFFWAWPWQPALGHLIALGVLGLVFVELAVSGTQKIPFTCSYLPGRSRAHLAIPVFVMIVIPAAIWAARFERDALQDAALYAGMLGVLVLTWAGARWRHAWLGEPAGGPQFEDEGDERMTTLDVWDVRGGR
jgi:CubicO group peptidase (beta-lactamase class C family)